jgi:hypothetical protein
MAITLQAKRTDSKTFVELEYLVTGTGAEQTLEGIYYREMKGKYCKRVRTVPGAGAKAPGGTYSVKYNNSDGATVFNITARSTSTAEREDVADWCSGYPQGVDPFDLVVGDIGSGKETTIKLKWDA